MKFPNLLTLQLDQHQHLKILFLTSAVLKNLFDEEVIHIDILQVDLHFMKKKSKAKNKFVSQGLLGLETTQIYLKKKKTRDILKCKSFLLENLKLLQERKQMVWFESFLIFHYKNNYLMIQCKTYDDKQFIAERNEAVVDKDLTMINFQRNCKTHTFVIEVQITYLEIR